MKTVQTKKFQDYRIKIFLILLKTLKALKLFQVQKIVRKIKSNKPQDKTKDIPKLEAKLAQIKSINVKDCRNLAFYIMRFQMDLDTKVQDNFFKFQVPENEKIDMEYLNINPAQHGFLKMAQESKRYKQALESLEDLLNMVDKKKSKTKQHRVNKQEKYQLKQQYKKDKEILEPVVTNLEKQKVIIAKTEKNNQKATSQFKQAQSIPLRVQKLNRPGQKQNELLKVESHPVAQQDQIKEPDYTFATMHPSWQAKIQLKQKENDFSQFSGKKIKLC